MHRNIPRRNFLAGSLAATAALGASAMKGFGAAAAPGGQREVYEMRIYQIKPGDMMKRADDYFQNALVPALRRAGAGPVGVLVESSKPETPAVYVLIPHPAMESVATLPGKLLADADYQKAAAAFLSAPPKDPAYTNLEVRLMLAADFIPKLEVPEKKDTRQFELRRYRSPSEPAFRKKLEMFGKLGELAIFRKVGLAPVFFGEMIMGPDMPNITYMLTYPDAAARKTGWAAFSKDPGWQKLRAMPGYTDPEIIANIQSLTLMPTTYSQI
jgi:hypothetical protein